MTSIGRRSPRSVAAALAVAGLVAAGATGCGKSSTSATSGGSGSGSKTIKIGVVQGWTDQTDNAYLFKHVLEKNGYTVNITPLSDNAPVYAGLARGDFDIQVSSWLERTQQTYWDQYKDKLEDIGTFYKGALNYMAVPTYSPVKSLDQLQANAALFGGKITGIEPGAGNTRLSKNAVSVYGMTSLTLVTSSTTAMLTELKKATEAKKEIVVTLWKPFWANSSFPVRALEDPKKAYGDPENLHIIGRKGFSTDQPKVAAMIKNFSLNDTQYNSLENLLSNKYKGNEDAGVTEWLKSNPDVETSMTNNLK